MSTLARVGAHDLTVSGLLWRRRPRVLSGGVELPRDSSGTHQLTGPDGTTRPVVATFDWRQLGASLRIGDETVPVGRPLPVAVRVVLVVFALLGLTGGALGVVLFAGAAVGSAALLRRTHRTGVHVAGAIALPVAAVVVLVVMTTALTLVSAP